MIFGLERHGGTQLLLLVLLAACSGGGPDSSPPDDSGGCAEPVTRQALMATFADTLCPYAASCSGEDASTCEAVYTAVGEDEDVCIDGCRAAACLAEVEAVTDCTTYEAALASEACYGIASGTCP